MVTVDLLINNEDVPATGGATFERRSPLSDDVATRAAAASPADAQKAVEAAKAAFLVWSATGPNQRRQLLLKAADVMEARANDFVTAMLNETGATPAWSGFNVHLASTMLREAASMTTQITGEVIPSDRPGRLAMSVRRPAGVVVGIAPWNAPVILGTRAIAMPLACGNTVILKASELCPATHRLIGDVLREAGMAPGVLNVVSNAPADAPAVIQALIAHPAVRRINFTGSTRVGKIIAGLAAQHLKPVLLELGGKAPFVVLDDADLDEAVKAAAFGAYMHQGQICMSTERLVVDESVADAFAAKMAAKIASLPAGDPRDPKSVLGCVVNPDAAERIKMLVDDAVAKGARLIGGGESVGTILKPALLDHVTSAMRIYSEESFGPVVAMIRVKGVDEAVRVANDTEYGLSSAVFGRDVNRALAVAERIESGICHINAATVDDEAQMPFGGVKGSGYGRFGGKAAINEFTDLRWITLQTLPAQYPI